MALSLAWLPLVTVLPGSCTCASSCVVFNYLERWSHLYILRPLLLCTCVCLPVSLYVMLVSLYPCTLLVCVRILVRNVCVLAYSPVSSYVTFVCSLTLAFVSHCLFHVNHGDFNSWSYVLRRTPSLCAYYGRLTVDVSPLFLSPRSLDLANRANRGLLLLLGLLC